MSGLSVSGIASGIDSDSIISQMVAFETRSISNLQTRIAFEESERLLFEDISSRLQDLKGATSVFSSDSLFASLSTSVSQPDLLSVSATDDAPRGTQRVRVMQLATSHRIGGTGIEDRTATPLLQGGFSASSFSGALSSVTSTDRSVEQTLSNTAADYDYLSNVKLSGTYTGDENVDIQIKLTSDVSIGASPSGTISYKVSTDGGQTFGSTQNATINGSGEATLVTTDGVGITLEGLANKDLKDDDLFEFRAYGKAALEFQIGTEGERQSIEITSDMTLDSLVRTINENTDLGLRADVLNDGSSTDPFRLILTSLTEGRAGNISILSNDSVINLVGKSSEDPVFDSIEYGGDVTVTTPTGGVGYDGSLGNSSLVIEMMDAGTVGGSAKFRVSSDGGLTFHDNNGAGFNLTSTVSLTNLKDDSGTELFGTSDLELNFTAGSFQVGDRVTMDLFDAEIETAQDALINVNGINLVKSSNVVDDVFDGLTLTLKDSDPNKVINVGVSEKAGDITAALGGFVEAYNSVMGVLHAQSKFNPDEDDSAPLLMGDSTVRQLQQSLQRYVTGRIGILGSDTISNLGDVGITTDSKTGQLNFNPTKLTQSLNSDPNGVRRLLSRFGDVIEGSNVSFVSSTNATKSGKFEVEVTQARTRAEVVAAGVATSTTESEKLIIRVNKEATTTTGNVASMVVNLSAGLDPSDQVTEIQKVFDAKELAVTASLEGGKIVIRHNEYGANFKIDVESETSSTPASGTVNNTGFKQDVRMDDQGTDLKGKINGVTVSAEDDVLVGKSGFAFDGLRVRIQNDFAGEAGTIRLNDGLGSSFTTLLDSFIGGEGLLDTRIGSFDSAISRLQTQIDRVNERASLLEERLRSKFTNLEVTLGRLNATGDFLTAQLKTLPGFTKKD